MSEMEEFVDASNYETTTLKFPENLTVIPPSSSPANLLYNKYLIIGILLFFVTLLLIAVIVHIIKSKIFYHNKPLDIYSQVASGEDTCSLAGSDDDFDKLYTSCQLYVPDDEVNTESTGDSGDFEYDCSSLSGGLSVSERNALINVIRGDMRS